MKLSIFVITLTFLSIMACTPEQSTDLTKNNVIPKPVSCNATHMTFVWNEETKLYFNAPLDHRSELQDYFTTELKQINGNSPALLEKPRFFSKNFLQFQLSDTFDTEGYALTIDSKIIKLSAKTEAGLIMGFQTLKQLLFEYQDSIPTGYIQDFPKYNYRGMMLDVSRHFFDVKDVKRLIDLISLYKINKLHLHLSDDQGWRIEIKSWPNLTKIGGSTQVGGGAGGFYTQEDFKAIVAYAKLRGIEIIPEIDMPGHTNAALASYPELNCDNNAPKLYTGMRVGFSSFCVHKDITYQLIDDVIREISAISPSPYFHIGGDESHATKHDDYIYFINRVLKIAEKYDKQVIGWDEIAAADIKPGNIVQHWRNKKNAVIAKEKGCKVILSPGSFAYLDMKYQADTKLGLDWAGLINTEKAYSWIPDTLINEISGNDIYGIEAPLWSETIETIDDMEYLTFPRLPGYAEIGWSQDSVLNFKEYKQRLNQHPSIFKKLDINYYPSSILD